MHFLHIWQNKESKHYWFVNGENQNLIAAYLADQAQENDSEVADKTNPTSINIDLTND